MMVRGGQLHTSWVEYAQGGVQGVLHWFSFVHSYTKLHMSESDYATTSRMPRCIPGLATMTEKEKILYLDL